jgi:uncharacterized protein YycO
LLITLFSRSPYYHVGIYAGNGQVIEMRVRGLVQRDLRGRDGAHYFVVIPAPDGTGQAALEWAVSQKGAKYALNDIIVIALDKLFPHWRLKYPPGNTYTCGEFVAVAFAQAGIRLLPDVELSNTEPGDLACLVPSGAQPQTFEEHQKHEDHEYGEHEYEDHVLKGRTANEQEQAA